MTIKTYAAIAAIREPYTSLWLTHEGDSTVVMVEPAIKLSFPVYPKWCRVDEIIRVTLSDACKHGFHMGDDY